MSPGFPHHHHGADRELDPEPRSYRITVLLERVTEKEGVEVLFEVADALAARGLAIRGEDDTVRSAIGLAAHPWPDSLGSALEGELAGTLHVVVPKAVPQAPDLGVDYSPN